MDGYHVNPMYCKDPSSTTNIVMPAGRYRKGGLRKRGLYQDITESGIESYWTIESPLTLSLNSLVPFTRTTTMAGLWGLYMKGTTSSDFVLLPCFIGQYSEEPYIYLPPFYSGGYTKVILSFNGSSTSSMSTNDTLNGYYVQPINWYPDNILYQIIDQVGPLAYLSGDVRARFHVNGIGYFFNIVPNPSLGYTYLGEVWLSQSSNNMVFYKGPYIDQNESCFNNMQRLTTSSNLDYWCELSFGG
jgi:hypothetical protein